MSILAEREGLDNEFMNGKQTTVYKKPSIPKPGFTKGIRSTLAAGGGRIPGSCPNVKIQS
jgi:hypothetical protein